MTLDCEILAPAGDLQSAIAALEAGADAVYLGLRRFSARAGAENFGTEELARVASFAHILGAKVYVALNTLVKDGETEEFFESARLAWNAGADALLMQDMFLGKELKSRYPEMVLHLSTQAGCCNVRGARLAAEYGFSRAVLARETPLAEIGKISSVIETEVFVQGALCTCFSGQCYLSSFIGNNSGNRGRCKQPCRKRYKLDREGYGEYAYALSPADLSVGERVKDLLAAGVRSVKIEGRMRRPEYCAAAVRYYRALLGGAPAGEAFSRLKRAYNRGDYTEGLAFGQNAFLSRKVQGHIGERVGTLVRTADGWLCKSGYPAVKGDCFKLLRGGEEAGGAAFLASAEGGFLLSSSDRLRAGDEVRLTTSVHNAEGFAPKRTALSGTLRFVRGEPARASCGGVVLTGEPLPAAKNAPLTEEEILACFAKTDGLPVEIAFRVETEGAFLPRSALNAFRRAFYGALEAALAPPRAPLMPVSADPPAVRPVRGRLNAVIGESPKPCDLFIYKPRDYGKLARPAAEGTVYLYLPPFLTSAEEEALRADIVRFDGIYCDGYYAADLARETGLPFFAGTGFHIANRYALCEAKRTAKYVALSDEISVREQDALAAEGVFALREGDIRVMDLLYCPFERTCAACDGRTFYSLTDEAGRNFPLRRYRMGGACRFELYNCASLRPCGGLASRLRDDSAESVRGAQTTRGHAERSVL